jgi:exodeoxyribonuclease VII large subunit
VISAVGHEIDTTLVDLAADLRAATPSAAAELAVPELVRLVHWQNALMSRAQQAILGRLDSERRRLAGWTAHGILTQPETLLREAKLRLDRLQERADRAWERRLREQRHRWDRAQAQIQSLNPEAILDRGYAYVTDGQGSLVTAVQIMPNEFYEIHWYNGSHWVTRVNR